MAPNIWVKAFNMPNTAYNIVFSQKGLILNISKLEIGSTSEHYLIKSVLWWHDFSGTIFLSV